MSGSPRLGAWIEEGQTHFRVWAPRASTVAVELAVEANGQPYLLELQGDRAGVFTGSTRLAGPSTRYRYRLDGGDSWPDPAARFQPEGVHGPSEVVDPSRFAWTDGAWRGPDRDLLVIYELHVGSFTPDGTYAAVAEHLTDLVDLGVTVIELLPLNACDGRWGWGYDGAALFAPWHVYGRPDDLRALIDHAHALGLGVILDVVYNHFGPAGNYTGKFSPDYVRQDVPTAWGPAINLGGPNFEHVRAFFIQNARHWVEEYHFDGFRVDATHALVDDGPVPFLSEFAREVRATSDRQLILIAEDHRNLDTIIRPTNDGGWDFDGVWADDFHHVMRQYLTGDRDGVFQDFDGTIAEAATTINRGWLKTGEYSNYRQKHRGTDPVGIPPERFVFCLQNHDRVGNRGKGDRLHHAIDPATNRAATAALVLAPETPILFMGQEWAAATPFFYFTDHAQALGQAIRDGRAREFRLYDDFNTPEKLASIPDPQAESTFRSGQLDWTERGREPHAATLRLHTELLRFRRADSSYPSRTVHAEASGPDSLSFTFKQSERVAIVHLQGAAVVDLAINFSPLTMPRVILSTETADFAGDPTPIRLIRVGSGWQVHFDRPGAVILAGMLEDPFTTSATR